MTLKLRLKWFIKYNIMIAPVVLAMYLPYNIFWLGYTPIQTVKWLLTAGVMFGIGNLVLAPYTRFVVRYLEKK